MEYELDKIFDVYQEKLLLEKYYRYIIPTENKEKLMYDFYLISFLDQFDLDNNVGDKMSGFGQKVNSPTSRYPLDENTIDSFKRVTTN